MPSPLPPAFGVIFDMNGVIIDDLGYHRDAYRVFSERYSRPITDEEFNSRMNGRKNSEIMEYLFGRPVPHDEALRLEEEKESLYRELYRDKRETLPGLVPFLEELREHSVPLAVATSAPIENVRFILDEMDLRKYFEAVIDASRVTRSKPEPDIYLLAAKELALEPEHCLVFEDSILGILAARRAGMKVIGVTTTHEAHELQDVERSIESFVGMRYADIAGLFRRAPAGAAAI